MRTTKSPEDDFLQILTRSSWIILTLLTLAGMIMVSGRFALGVLTGGLLALGNFYWLRSILQRILQQATEHPSRYAIIRYLLRLTLLGVAIYWLMRFNIDLSGLLLGLSVLVVTIIGFSIYHIMQRKGE